MKLQQPGIDNVARQLVEQPAAQMMQQAGMALQQRVAADRREAVAADIQADVRKYAEEAGPSRANGQQAGAVGPGADAGREVHRRRAQAAHRHLESPVNRKYQALGGEMQRPGREAGGRDASR
jgi:hypothetical protein